MNVIPPGHPYWHVRRVLASSGDVDRVTFSFYKYREREISDKRSVRHFSLNEFCDEGFVSTLIRGVPASQEMAFHGTVGCRGRLAVLPMVDMATGKIHKIQKIGHVGGFFESHLMQRINWYDSGRSFHGYGDSLISHEHWHKMMGLLLLLNAPGVEPIVDPRWVGHRLLAGYATLRWTCNSDYYVKMPELLAL
ncbi:hypothetical protein [Stenotrophomonas maltophilia]|uniref:primase 1D-like protein n=1 Tax=Stenotrophomonas maltophilia TaxID=40324 RepID=UPI003D18F580